jgi:microsomal dipeptidase-like Zn-dependent dipeptidase
MADQPARRSFPRPALIAVAIGLIVVIAFFVVGANLERFLNRVEPVALPEISDRAQRLHAGAFVVDMHADSLLLGRDLSQRSSVGHVDLPRLQDGGVALQFFTAVTVAPAGMNIDSTDGDGFDLLTLGGIAQLSPFATRGPFERALLQADRLKELIAQSGGQVHPIRNRVDLVSMMQRRASDVRTVGALFGLEGAHALEGDLANLDPLFNAGVRMIGLAHFFDNRFSGSAHGLEKGGLSENGRALVRRMEELGIIVDLAHVSPAAIDDVLAMVTRPVVVSHSGVRGTCDNNRNLSDRHVRAIAAVGGVIGIGYWEAAVCGTSIDHIVAAIRYVIDLVGDDHVGLGSDFDGATTTGFDTSQLAAITEGLLANGLSEGTVRKVLGANVMRILSSTLPSRE